jgi:hypothetical protein
MSAEPLPKLLAQWAQGNLTVEQAIGQMLQQLIALQKQLDELKQQWRKQPPPGQK